MFVVAEVIQRSPPKPHPVGDQAAQVDLLKQRTFSWSLLRVEPEDIGCRDDAQIVGAHVLTPKLVEVVRAVPERYRTAENAGDQYRQAVRCIAKLCVDLALRLGP